MAHTTQQSILALVLLAALLPQLFGGVDTRMQTLLTILLIAALLPQFRLFGQDPS